MPRHVKTAFRKTESGKMVRTRTVPRSIGVLMTERYVGMFSATGSTGTANQPILSFCITESNILRKPARALNGQAMCDDIFNDGRPSSTLVVI